MRVGELLGRPVTDRDGQPLGPVHDLRIDRLPGERGFAVLGLVVGGPRRAGLAHRLGFADDDQAGPAVLAGPLRRAAGAALWVKADDIAAWGPDEVVLRRRSDELERFRNAS